MSQKSLGIIETIGLAAAVEAADAAVKSAAVELVGYELTKGSGMTVVKVEGNVGAVKAAIDAAAIASARVGTVVSTKVIARPSEQIGILVRNPDTVGWAEAGPKGPDNSGGGPDGPDGSGKPGGADGSDPPGGMGGAEKQAGAGGVKSRRGPGRPPGSGRAQANANTAAAGSSEPSALKRQESEIETASKIEAEAGGETETLTEALVQESLWPRMTSGPAENAAAWDSETGSDGTAETDTAGADSAETDSGSELERESGLHTELNSESDMEPDTELEPDFDSDSEPDLDSDPDSDPDLGPKPGSYTCNICKDPDCPRRKGDLKQLCIHYRKKNKG